MHHHAPADYLCPICLAIRGVENDDTWIKQVDIFYRDDLALGFISSKFIRGNEGHPLLVPIQHVENIYDMPREIGHHLMDQAKKIAQVLKEVRKCDGVTFVQNNEPAGDQHAFHYHMHIIPRFKNDHFHQELWNTYRSEPEERIAFAEELKKTMLDDKIAK